MALVKRNGQLYEETAAPKTAPAVSPAGVKAAGGTPAQVGAAGTPNQKQPVVKQQTERRPQQVQPVRQQSTQERQQAQQQQQLGQLGGLGERVQARVQEGLGERLAGAGIAADEAGDVETKLSNMVRGYTDEAGVVHPPMDYATAITTLNQEMTAGGQTAVADVLQKQYEGYQAPTMGGLAQDFSDLGIDQSEAAGILGVSPEQLAGMDINQFQSTIDSLKSAAYQRAEQLESEVSTLPAGSAQKEALESELTELQGTGVTETEAEMAETEQEIQEADQLEIDGETYELDEILAEDAMADRIKRYLEGDIAALPEDNPVFASIKTHVDRNRNEYTTKVAATAAEGEKFRGVQKEAEDAFEEWGLDEAGMEEILGEIPAGLTAVELKKLKQDMADLDAPTMLQKLGITPDQTTNLGEKASELNDAGLLEKYQELQGYLKTDPKELAKSGKLGIIKELSTSLAASIEAAEEEWGGIAAAAGDNAHFSEEELMGLSDEERTKAFGNPAWAKRIPANMDTQDEYDALVAKKGEVENTRVWADAAWEKMGGKSSQNDWQTLDKFDDLSTEEQASALNDPDIYMHVAQSLPGAYGDPSVESVAQFVNDNKEAESVISSWQNRIGDTDTSNTLPMNIQALLDSGELDPRDTDSPVLQSKKQTFKQQLEDGLAELSTAYEDYNKQSAIEAELAVQAQAEAEAAEAEAYPSEEAERVAKLGIGDTIEQPYPSAEAERIAKLGGGPVVEQNTGILRKKNYGSASPKGSPK